LNIIQRLKELIYSLDQKKIIIYFHFESLLLFEILKMTDKKNGNSDFGKVYLDYHNAADAFRARIKEKGLLPAIGVYDVFSASLAARKFETIFLSGYGFCASTYALPDEGFIAWPDMVSYCERVRAVIPGSYHCRYR
jgi:hypothetical protein